MSAADENSPDAPQRAKHYARIVMRYLITTSFIMAAAFLGHIVAVPLFKAVAP